MIDHITKLMTLAFNLPLTGCYSYNKFRFYSEFKKRKYSKCCTTANNVPTKNIALAFSEHEKLFTFYSKSPLQWVSESEILGERRDLSFIGTSTLCWA